MQVTTSWMSQKYTEFNEKYFENSLPDASEINFSVNHRQHPMGFASFSVNRLTRKVYNLGIAISNFYDCSEHGKEGILIHEMCHISHYCKRINDFLKRDGRGVLTINRRFDGHSGLFLEEAARINAISDYNVSQYYPSEATDEAITDDLYNLSDKAKKRLSAQTYVCVFNGFGREFLYFHCPKNRIKYYNDWLKEKNCTDMKWFVTSLSNMHGIPKCTTRLCYHWRKNDSENNIDFLKEYFNMTPYETNEIDEKLKRIVDDVISEITKDNKKGNRIKASSIPIVKQNDDILYYGIE